MGFVEPGWRSVLVGKGRDGYGRHRNQLPTTLHE